MVFVLRCDYTWGWGVGEYWHTTKCSVFIFLNEALNFFRPPPRSIRLLITTAVSSIVSHTNCTSFRDNGIKVPAAMYALIFLPLSYFNSVFDESLNHQIRLFVVCLCPKCPLPFVFAVCSYVCISHFPSVICSPRISHDFAIPIFDEV
jgi:hypothetical protein